MTVALQISLALVAVIGVLAVVAVGGKVLVQLTHPDDPTHAPGAHVLRHHFVAGPDPAAVLDAVRRAGYHATTEYDMGQVDLLVACSGDPTIEREKVCAAIAADRQGIHGDAPLPAVRFADEFPDPR